VTAVLQSGPDADGGAQLLPGMLVRLQIITQRHADALVVPKRAVRREGDQAYLFAESGGEVRRVEFDEGFTDDDDVEVLPLQGFTLEAGDAVVVIGNRELEDGMVVRVENAPGDAAAGAEGAEPPADETSAEPADESSGDGAAGDASSEATR
jgi:multidrug efflux pump subunit AcrA (membrane-fusion protein)